MHLSKANLNLITGAEISKPVEALFQLPEKVLQFGTGVLLRGLCDYFIQMANEKGFFNGRVVVVKSTEAGEADAFQEQDDLYTICVRGLGNGNIVEENIICSAISRVLSAKREWGQILQTVNQPDLKIIISNTTEVGIQLVKESIRESPPSSFPAKLLAVLYQRFTHFKGSEDSGMVVIPTELISDNGKKLRSIVEELAKFNQLENAFMKWLNERVTFCNSLVDRIVTKDPGEALLQKLQDDLGYEDKLLTMCEDYRLWAIEGPKEMESLLSFIQGDSGVFVKPDIEIFKSLKLHLLNGTHTLSASLAFLSGFDTVKQAMGDPVFSAFVEQLMLKEIAMAIPYPIPIDEINKFALKVLDRFRNPFLQHRWINITFQNTMKMRMRNLPVIIRCQELSSTAVECMATGFAAYILFMKAVKKDGAAYYGLSNGKYYLINDDQASFFYALWQEENSIELIVTKVLANKDLWGVDLSAYSHFEISVRQMLPAMISAGVRETIIKWHQTRSMEFSL